MVQAPQHSGRKDPKVDLKKKTYKVKQGQSKPVDDAWRAISFAGKDLSGLNRI